MHDIEIVKIVDVVYFRASEIVCEDLEWEF